MRKLAGLLILWFCTVAVVHAQQSVLEVIDLRYRNAQEVLPLLQSFIAKDGSINALDNRLVVRTSPQNLAELKQILAGIDRRPRQLRVTVTQDADRGANARRGEVTGTIGGGNASVTLPGRPGDTGTGATVGTGRLKGKVLNSGSADVQRNGHTVTVMEGNSAFISVGQTRPVTTSRLIAGAPVPSTGTMTPQDPDGSADGSYGLDPDEDNPYAGNPVGNPPVVIGRGGRRSVLAESTRYRQAATGFMVKPRVSGDLVTVEIRGGRDQFTDTLPGATDTQRFDTVISGRLGEWIELGGTTRSSRIDANGITYRSSDAAHDERRLFLMVEEVR